MFQNLMETLKVRKAGPGATRTRPDQAMADRAYSSKDIRQYLRERGIQCVIPEREDPTANRKRMGKASGRPMTYDREAYKRRNVVECSFNALKQWRSLATRVRLARPDLPIRNRPARRVDLERSKGGFPIRIHVLGVIPPANRRRYLLSDSTNARLTLEIWVRASSRETVGSPSPACGP